MIAGIVFIVAGLLIALYPPLLSIIVAALLILAGIGLISFAHFQRKLDLHYRNPVVETFFRF